MADDTDLPEAPATAPGTAPAKKRLSIRAPGEGDAAAPALQKKGRGWAIAESRLDTIHELAREKRRHPTPAQALLAERMAEADLGGFKFRRQAVIGSAVVDFACQQLKLVVGIDDPEHGDPALDRRRDKSLGEVGQQVIRFAAADVLADPDAVVAKLREAMVARWHDQRARRAHTRPAPRRSRD